MAEERRLQSIDAFRGLAIVLMVAANYLAGVRSVPPWLKHAPDIGLTVVDLIAPMFVFAIGLTYARSARRRRERDGGREAVLHLLRRYLAIAGIGALLAAGEELFGFGSGGSSWGVLQAIGFSGVLLLCLVFAPWWARLLAAAALLSIYQLGLDRFWLATVLRSSHGGLPGTLGWAGMLGLATALGDLFRQDRTGAPVKALASVGVLGAGLLLALLVPVSKNRVSASYVLVATGASALLYLAFTLLCDARSLRFRHLGAWGASPLVLYLLHEPLLAVFVLPGLPWWYAEAAPALVVAQLVLLLALLGAVAEVLTRRGVLLKL